MDSKRTRHEIAARENILDEMAKHDLNYKDLFVLLGKIPDDPDEMDHQVKLFTQKIRRGKFPHALAIEIAQALKLRHLDMVSSYQVVGIPMPPPPDKS